MKTGVVSQQQQPFSKKSMLFFTNIDFPIKQCYFLLTTSIFQGTDVFIQKPHRFFFMKTDVVSKKTTLAFWKTNVVSKKHRFFGKRMLLLTKNINFHKKKLMWFCT